MLKLASEMQSSLSSGLIDNPYMLAAFAGLITCMYLHKRPMRTDYAVGAEFAAVAALACFELNRTSYLAGSLLTAASLTAVHILTFISVTVAYRLSPFHPLGRYPGPLVNKITSIPAAYRTFTGERPFYIEDLHKRYGRAVRIGPDFVSINSVNALNPIYGSGSAMIKSRAYTFGGVEGDGLFFMQNRELHSKRRKLWSPAFSQNVIREFRKVFEHRSRQLIDVIESRGAVNKRGVIDMGALLCHYTYDVMTDLTFGSWNPVNMLEDGDPENLVKSGQLATIAFEILGEVPSLTSVLWHFPLTKKMRALEDRAGKWMAMRQSYAKAENQVDIASFLLGDGGEEQSLSDADLRIDGLFAIQAGSDTPAGVLTFIYYFLARFPETNDALRRELDAAFPDPTIPLDMHKLAQLPYLNAVIMEGTRLGTPFHGFPRIVAEGGTVIDKWFVPGGMTVSVPGWSMHIDEENFYPDPLVFRPERWLPGGLGPDTRTNKAAWIPFSLGLHGCLGKQLAMEELLTTVARTTLECDVTFAPGFDADKFWAGVRNIRTPVFKEPLQIVAKRRRAGD